MFVESIFGYNDFMSRKDKIKIKLDIIKMLILAMLTALFGVCSFIVLHHKELDLFVGISAIISIVALVFSLCYLSISFNKELNKLEKEK